MGTAPAPAQTPREIVLHTFGINPKGGRTPYSGVTRDAAANLYGTTVGGGAYNAGVVFKLDPAGYETVLYHFKNGTDGAYPYAGLILDSAGNLYGTTYTGGTAHKGVVYRVDPAGQETVLYSFQGGADGAYPRAGVVMDATGNLYGTTPFDDTMTGGGVYKLDPAGHLTVLYSFAPGAGPGPWSTEVLILDSAGNLYGTTPSGGPANNGMVYKLDPSGQLTVLYSFTGAADGGRPVAGVTLDTAGNIFGTTVLGGASDGGVAFKLNAVGQETVLLSFGNEGPPDTGLVRDPVGNLFGATGPPGYGYIGDGVAYKLDPAGNETVLHEFTSAADGGTPSGVILDSAGNVYGTAGVCVGSFGVVFRLDPAGHEKILHSFSARLAVSSPEAGVVRDASGNLYGTAAVGTDGAGTAGAVYKVDATGHETTLHSFTGGADGARPNAGVTLDAAGNLYGTTFSGGAAQGGVVYKLDTSGQETVLHSFTGGADGAGPIAGVILNATGNLYGTTSGGGAFGHGVVYEVDAAGQETVLYSFQGGTDGASPNAGVIRDSAGNLYGTTPYGGGPENLGVVYELDTAGQETVLYRFTGGDDGYFPFAGVIRDPAGNLYGTAGGGVANEGLVYKLDTEGQLTVLHAFARVDGAAPSGGVIADSAGNLYGATAGGGFKDGGVIYEITGK
jgi:uncharacterized repeat protein (TIGR03803 family)